MDCYGGFDLHIWEAQLGGGWIGKTVSMVGYNGAKWIGWDGNKRK